MNSINWESTAVIETFDLDKSSQFTPMENTQNMFQTEGPHTQSHRYSLTTLFVNVLNGNMICFLS